MIEIRARERVREGERERENISSGINSILFRCFPVSLSPYRFERIMNNSPQNTEVAGQQHRAGVENSDEEEWSGVVECVMLLHRLVYRKNDFYLLKQPS